MRDTPGATKRIMSGQRGCKSAATVPWVASLIIFPTGLRFSHADPPIYHGHSVVVNSKRLENALLLFSKGVSASV